MLTGGYSYVLYNHKEDPDLYTDLTAQHPQVAQELKQALEAWGAQVDNKSQPVDVRTQQQEEALRSLGYME